MEHHQLPGNAQKNSFPIKLRVEIHLNLGQSWIILSVSYLYCVLGFACSSASLKILQVPQCLAFAIGATSIALGPCKFFLYPTMQLFSLYVLDLFRTLNSKLHINFGESYCSIHPSRWDVAILGLSAIHAFFFFFDKEIVNLDCRRRD